MIRSKNLYMNWFKDLVAQFTSTKQSNTVAQAPTQAPKPMSHAVYPPPHDGIPLASVDDLMQAQSALIGRLRMHTAKEEHVFDERFLVPIRALAAYISNIPGTRDGIYGGPGGLFRACLEMAFFCFQSSDGRIFTGHLGVEDRFNLEKRWRYICFLSGLIWPLGNTLEKIRVRDLNGNAWSTRVESLLDWSQRVDTNYYVINWPKDDIEPGPSITAAALAFKLIGDKALAWIERGSPDLVTAVSEIITGVRSEYNAIAFELVSGRWEKLCQSERARLGQNYGRVRFGQHWAPVIIDGMRELLASDKWQVNLNIVMADAQGVYLLWPQAGQDLISTQALAKSKGSPKTPAGLIQLMIDEKLVVLDLHGSPYSEIVNADGELLPAVKVSSPDMCIEGYDPSNYSGHSYQKAQASLEQAITPTAPKPKTESVEKTDTAEKASPSDLLEDDDDYIAPPPAPAQDVLTATLGCDAEASKDDVSNDDVDPKVGEMPNEGQPGLFDESQIESNATSNTTAPQEVAKAKKAGNKKGVDASDTGSSSKQAEKPKAAAHAVELPQDIEEQLPSVIKPMLRALVGEVQKAINQKKLRVTPAFVAIPADLLMQVLSRPSDFLICMQKNGWLHALPSKPRAMVHEMAVSEGGALKANYVLFEPHFALRVGITKPSN